MTSKEMKRLAPNPGMVSYIICCKECFQISMLNLIFHTPLAKVGFLVHPLKRKRKLLNLAY